MNDREQLLVWQHAQQDERNTVTQMDHYHALGIGLAMLCVAMYRALVDDKTFTAEQALALVGQAVQGR